MEQATRVKEDECDWVSAPEFPGLQYKLLIDSTKIDNHGLSLGSLELVPGGELPLHHHSPQEIYIIRKGKGLLLSKTETREVFPETSIYIPKNEKHGLKNIGDNNLLIYWIFPTDCWADVRYLYGE
jgi:mannose-6-phosphate isomerase-like protein (cupin superfamily)